MVGKAPKTNNGQLSDRACATNFEKNNKTLRRHMFSYFK